MSGPKSPALPEQVGALFTHLDHAGVLGGANVIKGEAGSIALGVQVRFYWCIEGSQLLEARYQAYGCPYTLACCEWLARSLAGRSREVPWPGGPHQWAVALAVPPERLGRLLVIEDALRATLSAWPVKSSG